MTFEQRPEGGENKSCGYLGTACSRKGLESEKALRWEYVDYAWFVEKPRGDPRGQE